MTDSSQTRAVRKYRSRLKDLGKARFEVVGLERDRDLVRAVARRLAEESDSAQALRDALRRALGGKRRRVGGVLAALRNSPMVGEERAVLAERAGDHGFERREFDL